MNDTRPFRSVRFAIVAAVLSCSFAIASTVHAQNDQVYLQGNNKAQRGEITAMTKNGVTLKIGAATKDFPAGEIGKVAFTGEPGELTKGREFAVDGQYEQALEALEQIDMAKLKRDFAKADASFYSMYSKAKMALAGRGDKGEAANMAMGFAKTQGNSYHFYETAKLLGDLALSMDNPTQALRFYGSLRSAPTTETQIESVYLSARTLLVQNEFDKATAEFDKIIGVKANTPGVVRLQMLSKAGKAVALAKSGKAEEGLKLVNSLIENLNPTDVEMAARIYNAQGDSSAAAGDVEGAILAYLHTHLMFSSEPSAHAEALTRLVQLWPKVGKPERAAEARQELQNRYPGYSN